jgi:hypothetical protein
MAAHDDLPVSFIIRTEVAIVVILVAHSSISGTIVRSIIVLVISVASI